MEMNHFKKMNEDAKTAEVMHKDGHKITIAKAGLSPEMRAKLAEMPLYKEDGGVIEDPNADLENEKDANSEVDEEPTYFPSILGKLPIPSVGGLSGKTGEGPMEAPPEEVQMAANSQNNSFEGGGAPQATLAAFDPNAQAPTNISLEMPPAPVTPAQPTDGNGVLKALDQQRQGVLDQGKIAMDKAKEEVAIVQGHNLAMEALKNAYEEQHSAISNEIASVTKEMQNGTINPNQYLDNMSTKGKIFSAIGMLLSGAGSGLTGAPNLAIKFLDEQIERNIHAQRANLDKNNNVLSALNHQLGNLQDATQMYTAIEKENYANSIQQAASKFGGPEAQAKAKVLAGAYQMQAAQLKDAIAQRRALMQSPTGGVDNEQSLAQKIRLLPADDQKEAAKELAQYHEDRKLMNDAVKAYKLVQETKTAAFKAGHPLRAFSGAQEAQFNGIIDALMKKKGVRITPENRKHFEKQFKPSKFDTAEDVQLRMDALVDELGIPTYPTLSKYPFIQLDKKVDPKLKGNTKFVSQEFYKGRKP